MTRKQRLDTATAVQGIATRLIKDLADFRAIDSQETAGERLKSLTADDLSGELDGLTADDFVGALDAIRGVVAAIPDPVLKAVIKVANVQ